jgi:hypothetical protein
MYDQIIAARGHGRTGSTEANNSEKYFSAFNPFATAVAASE